MASTPSKGHNSDNTGLQSDYTRFAASHSSLPAVRRDERSFLDLPVELRCMVYEHFLPENQLVAYPKPSIYNALIHICKQIREEAQKEIQKAADGYFRAHDARWFRKPSFHFTIQPAIDPTHITVVIPEVFPEFHDPDTFFLRIPLLRLPLQQITLDISTAIANTTFPFNKDALRHLQYWIRHHIPQARRTTIHWGHCHSQDTMTAMSDFCRGLEFRSFFHLQSGEYKLLTECANVTHQGNEHGVSEAVAVTFQRTPLSREEFLEKLHGRAKRAVRRIDGSRAG